MCGPGEVLPRRRVSNRRQGGSLDGRPRPYDQWQLRRIYSRPGLECRSDRIGFTLGRTRHHSRNLRDRLDVLVRNLEIQKRQLLVIRGATSSFGQAALKMAVNAGARVIATTRSRDRFAILEKLGAERCEVERRDLSKHIVEAKKIDAVLDLVGNTVVLDSLAMLRRGGRSCLAGWLGGLDPIHDFNPLLQMASGVYLTFFGSFVFGTPGFPLSDVPLQQIAADAAAGRLDVKPARIFRFEEIHEAHRVMEANGALGKMVVVHD
jgi:NADPH2:quinone reductase